MGECYIIREMRSVAVWVEDGGTIYHVEIAEEW